MPKFRPASYFNAENFLNFWNTSSHFTELPTESQEVLRSNFIHWYGDILEDERLDISLELVEISKNEPDPAKKQLLAVIAEKIKRRGRD